MKKKEQRGFSESRIASDFFKKIASLYSIGNLAVITRVEHGAANITYHLVADSKKEYFLRIFKEFDRAVIDNEHHVSEVLFGSVRVPHMLKVGGEYVFEVEGAYVSMSAKLEGKHLRSSPTKSQAISLGLNLAQFHTILANHSLPHPTSVSFLNPESVEARLKSIAPGAYRADVMSLILQSSRAQKHDLPSGIVHGDFHTNNFLVDELEIAILDLQNLHYGPYISDISRAIADMYSTLLGFDYDLIEAFLEGYEMSRKLTPSERELLNDSIAYNAAAVSTWFYARGDAEFATKFLKVGLNFCL